MHNFKRGTILKLTCDIHEFLSKAPKAYEDLIDIISEDGTVKVKTHNGDHVGFYGMKAKIHTRFMKQFVDVTPDKIEVPVVKLDDGHMEAIDEQVASLDSETLIDHEDAKVIIEQRKNEIKEDYETGMRNAMKDIAQLCGYKFAIDVGYEDIAEKVSSTIELKQALLEEVTDSLATAASKLNSLGYEFTGCDWMHQDDIKKYKISAMANKIYEMTAIEVAELLVKHNIEL